MNERQEMQEYSLQEKMYIFLGEYRELSWLAGVIIIIIAVFVWFFLWLPELFDFGIDPTNIIFYFVVGAFVFYSMLRLKKRTDVRKILDEYIRQNYYLSFQTLRPEGKNQTEKFMSLAVNIFPSLKEAIKKFEEKGKKLLSTHDKLDGDYKFDISLDTDEGKFLVKFFQNTIKFKDIEKIVDIAVKFYRKKTVLRIICVAKKYDELFFTDDLSKKMEELLPQIREYRTFFSHGLVKKWIRLDLILERENGYTTIWID